MIKRMNPYLTPKAKDIGFNSATRRTVIEESSNTTVDLERRYVEQSTFESIDDGLSKSFTVKRTVTGAAAAADGGLELFLDGGFLKLQFVE